MAQSTVITKFVAQTDEYDRKVKRSAQNLTQFARDGKLGMEGLTKVIGSNIAKFASWGAAIAAAGKVLKDTFNKNETYVDDWGRTVESAKGVYDGFLNTLNTSNFSGFLLRIGDITEAARNAYDALDELGTFNAFNQINLTKARAGFANAVADYREGTGSKEGVMAASETLIGNLEEQKKLEENRYYTKVLSLAKNNKVNGEELYNILGSGTWSDLKEIKKIPMPVKEVWDSRTRSFIQEFDYAAATEEQLLADMLRHFSDKELDEIQKLGVLPIITEENIANVRKQRARYLGSNQGSAGVSSPSSTKAPNYGPDADKYMAEQNALAFLNPFIGGNGMVAGPVVDIPQMGSLAQLNEELSRANSELERLAPGTDAWREALERVAAAKDDIAHLNAIMNVEEKKTAETTKTGWQSAAGAVSQLAGAVGNLGSTEVNIAGIIAGAIANVAAGFGAAVAGQGKNGNVWEWIAAAISGSATMFATIAAIKSATEYHAGGGVVGMGSVFTPKGTDTIPCMLSPGERVIPAGASANVPTFGGVFAMRLSGGDIIGALENTNRSRGGVRGMYAYTR